MKYQIYKPTEQRIKEMAACDRPRERLILRGAEALSDQELLSILIGSGNRDRSVNAIAKDLLDLLDRKPIATNEDLMAIGGLGMAKATLIGAALELGRRRLPAKRRQISTPADIFPLIRHYAARMQEHFLSVCLNGAHEVLSVNVCSIGLVNRTLVHPREVFGEAVRQRATAILVAHNHPSGNLEPSMEDKDVTRRLKQAGDILGIKVLDHLIFSEEGYLSMLEGNEF
ncbi:RadC family protein [Sphaerochaeta halotolerans]|uniref:RadC family protein n=1 Tax=Sphaerochaeta halotolerans TaxID=2293840 RepID=UPI00136A68A0|nr:DNA repair protein RadC [Sphaerochaeta halotolerans]MXI86694.1 DNA repair protein RadC [Sphaerochaeta halotolerans]